MIDKPPSLAYDDGTPYATDVVVIKDGEVSLVVTKRKEKLDNKRLNFNLDEIKDENERAKQDKSDVQTSEGDKS